MPQLYLDCDGVLADFDTGAEKLLGMNSREYEGVHGTNNFWDTLKNAEFFFQNLPVMPGARELYTAVKHLEPIILTGVPEGGWAELQKLRWAKKHFPGVKMITCFSKDKSLYCRPGDVLVDDWPKYKSLWEAKGGIFIEHTDTGPTLRTLQQIGIL